MRLLEPGTHRVNVCGARLTESNAKRTPAIEIDFANGEGMATAVRWVTPGTAQYVTKDLHTLGLSDAQIADPETLHHLNKLLMDAECDIVVEEENYKGEPQLRVRWINEVSSEPSGDIVSSVYGLLNGKPSAVRAASAPRPPQPASSGPAPFVDEDLPF